VEHGRRKKVVIGQWNTFRNAAHGLPLPESPTPTEHIVCVAVMNIPHLTTAIWDGVIVTDELCIQRYLSDPEIEVLSDGVRIGTLGDIRGEMSPGGFVKYLIRPPQVAYVDEALHPEIFMLPSIGKELPTLLWTLAYTPKSLTRTVDDAEEAAQRRSAPPSTASK
jgi:hypothetical protein